MTVYGYTNRNTLHVIAHYLKLLSNVPVYRSTALKLATSNLLPVKTEDAQMAAIPTIQSCKLLDPKEESIIDLEVEVYETI